MAVFTKVLLSGSTDGRPIDVVATATPGTLIHTADATDTDEIWIYAVNTSGADRDLTIEFGGVTAADLITVKVESDAGLVLIVPGLPLTNSLVVRAFGSIASDMNIVGFVNRIT